jgi:hypothetical protein
VVQFSVDGELGFYGFAEAMEHGGDFFVLGDQWIDCGHDAYTCGDVELGA